MDAETYSNPAVQEELQNWNFVKVDVDDHGQVPTFFGTSGIPQAIMVAPDGTQAPAIPGFVAPGPFVQMLKDYRASR